MEKPNIVIILSDQHNAGILGCNGDRYIKTPHIDKLAANGVNFRSSYCPAPLCVPSRMSFLTGRLPYKTKVFNNHQALHSDNPTLAHTITNAGYETLLAGRMHFTGEDQHHGFEKRLVGDLTPFYQGYDSMTESFGDLFDAFLPGPAGIKKSGAGMTSISHYDKAVVEETETFLKSRSDERPLFLTVGLSAPHPPFICEKDAFDRYYNTLPEWEEPEDSEKNIHPALKDYRTLRKMDLVKKKDLRRIRAAYYGLVEMLDKNVGRILKIVQETLGLDNTIIVYTSDHGEQLGTHNLIWKGTFLENSVKIPMIISAPQHYLQSAVVDDPVSMLDLTNTLVSAAEAEELPDGDGVSLIDYLTVKDHKIAERPIVSQLGNYPRKFVPMAMIRKGKYKLIYYHGYQNPSLFDLSQDPNELNDLGKENAYAGVVKELNKELHRNWNGKEVDEHCKMAYKHYEILDKWSHTTHFSKKENWKVPSEMNFLN